MNNREWVFKHIGHAQYARDRALADADLARLAYRSTGLFVYFREWKQCIRDAWNMRQIIRRNRNDLR